jgi:hypothetical protein
VISLYRLLKIIPANSSWGTQAQVLLLISLAARSSPSYTLLLHCRTEFSSLLFSFSHGVALVPPLLKATLQVLHVVNRPASLHTPHSRITSCGIRAANTKYALSTRWHLGRMVGCAISQKLFGRMSIIDWAQRHAKRQAWRGVGKCHSLSQLARKKHHFGISFRAQT